MFNRVENSYRYFMQGKRVAIIGGADNFDMNAVVDRSDVIVRINNHVKRQKGPCDVLYHTVVCDDPPNMSLLDAMEDPPFFIFLNLVDTQHEYGERERPLWDEFASLVRKIHPQCEIGHYAHGTWGGKNPYDDAYDWLNDLQKMYETKFFTGVVAIAHILQRTECAELAVYGMDLYLDESQGDIEFQKESHPLRGNVGLMVDLMKDDRLEYDAPVLAAIDKYISTGK